MMIEVAIGYHNQDIKTLVVKGHANSAPYGQDLVCAGTTAIMNGAFNAFNHLTPKQVALISADNLLKIEVKTATDEVNQLMAMLHIQLATIAEQYPKNIQIREVH